MSAEFPPREPRPTRRALAGGLGAAALYPFLHRREMPTDPKLPVLFVSHGAPTLALDARRGAELARWARGLPAPRALLVVSAHWERSPVSLGTTASSELLYDFRGFPPELSRLRYAAPNAPELAARVEELLGPLPRLERRWDHGVWVPLVHMVPRADVPLLQLSLPSAEGPRALLELGRKLAPLREEGVLVLASGGMVHDLGSLEWSDEDTPPERVPSWAREFEGWARAALDAGDADALAGFRERAPASRRAHPTAEHFLPLLVAVGAAGATPGAARYPVEGFEHGSLSRLCIELS